MEEDNHSDAGNFPEEIAHIAQEGDLSDDHLELIEDKQNLDQAEDDSKHPCIRKRRLLKKAPDAPKRFKSAYICFVTEKMEDVKKELPPDKKVMPVMRAVHHILFGTTSIDVSVAHCVVALFPGDGYYESAGLYVAEFTSTRKT